MSIRTKYIKVLRDDGVEEIFTFPSTVDHDAMFEAIRCVKTADFVSWVRLHNTAVSAGFVSYDLQCYGKSITLGLESDPEKDTALLRKQLRIS